MDKIGIILVVILLLLTLKGANYFLGIAKASFTEWIFFNACAPTGIAYLIGFIIYLVTKDRTALHVAILPLFFFGGLALYLFPWGGYNNIPQVNHIFMVLNAAWVLVGTFRTSDYKAATIGLLLGIFIFGPFINIQQTYVNKHPEACKKILGIDIGDFQEKYHIEK
jgi:hypothetical protein